MKATDLVVPAVAVVGGAIVLNQVMKFLGASAGAFGDVLAGLNPIPHIGQAVTDAGAAATNFSKKIIEGDPATTGAIALLGPVGGIAGGIGNITGLLLGASGNFTVTPESAHHGEMVHLKATGLYVPKEPELFGIWPLRYGWKELNFALGVASVNGTFETDILINDTTPPGSYTVYVDQRPWGVGHYYEKKFIVLKDGEAPRSSFWNFFGIPLDPGFR